jgi:hypothetical protein
MPFQQDVSFADEVGQSYGKYHSTFRSQTGQVLAQLFVQNGRLVDRLRDEWPDGRDFLKGIDFGLRHKMTTGLRLLGCSSFYLEPDSFWQDLSASYGLRNRIIHDGQIAHEDDAKLAINVARNVVRIATSLR